MGLELSKEIMSPVHVVADSTNTYWMLLGCACLYPICGLVIYLEGSPNGPHGPDQQMPRNGTPSAASSPPPSPPTRAILRVRKATYNHPSFQNAFWGTKLVISGFNPQIRSDGFWLPEDPMWLLYVISGPHNTFWLPQMSLPVFGVWWCSASRRTFEVFWGPGKSQKPPGVEAAVMEQGNVTSSHLSPHVVAADIGMAPLGWHPERFAPGQHSGKECHC